ncbi:MAG TPA: HIRAN domain-containing protein [Allosphingosinicella sp.]|jgi:hypothetical protein
MGYPIGVVGESFRNEDGSERQEEIARCRAGETVELLRDPENRFDANCVRVVSERGVQIGNISRDDYWIAERIDRGASVRAEIMSICTNVRGLFGVVLDVSTD